MKQTLTALVLDQPGVLMRVAGLVTRRGFNIDSLTVGPTEEAGLSRMTITLDADAVTVEQIIKQLYKLVDVVKVQDISDVATVERELLLVKVSAPPALRAEIAGLIEPFRASVVDVGRASLILQATGAREKNDALLELLQPYGVMEIARTGVTALVRSQALVHLHN
jgi:acetolactate synthase-1/3 small subunit